MAHEEFEDTDIILANPRASTVELLRVILARIDQVREQGRDGAGDARLANIEARLDAMDTKLGGTLNVTIV